MSGRLMGGTAGTEAGTAGMATGTAGTEAGRFDG